MAVRHNSDRYGRARSLADRQSEAFIHSFIHFFTIRMTGYVFSTDSIRANKAWTAKKEDKDKLLAFEMKC